MSASSDIAKLFVTLSACGEVGKFASAAVVLHGDRGQVDARMAGLMSEL